MPQHVKEGGLLRVAAVLRICRTNLGLCCAKERGRERKREQGKVAVERSAVVNTSQVHRQAVALLIDVY